MALVIPSTCFKYAKSTALVLQYNSYQVAPDTAVHAILTYLSLTISTLVMLGADNDTAGSSSSQANNANKGKHKHIFSKRRFIMINYLNFQGKDRNFTPPILNFLLNYINRDTGGLFEQTCHPRLGHFSFRNHCHKLAGIVICSTCGLSNSCNLLLISGLQILKTSGLGLQIPNNAYQYSH